MQSKKAADIGAEVGAERSRVDAPSRREFPAEPDEHWGPVVGHLNGLGPALIEIYEAGGEHPIKIELLDQVVSIVRRKKTSDERVREIAILMRDWQQMRRG
jgi:hypothetical protein